MERRSIFVLCTLACLAVVGVYAAVAVPGVLGQKNEAGEGVVISSGEITIDRSVDKPVGTAMDGTGTGASPRGGMPPVNLSEMTAEKILSQLEMMQVDGIDTTEAEAALEDGDLDAVLAFMEANRPADGGPGDRPDGHS